MARRRSGKKIDFVHWQAAQVSSPAQSAGAIGVTVAAAQHEPETLLRMRGNAFGYIDGGQAVGGQIVVGMGIILVPEGTSTTVLWAPITDSDAPWIWVDYFRLGYEEMVTDVIDVPVMTGYRTVIDNKAMRIARNQEVQAVFENVTALGTLSANLGIDVRLLAGK